jgi:hypothetical protein
MRSIEYIQRYQAKYQAERREKVLRILGGRCNSPTCRWQNADGSFGCDDPRALQVDHPNGGGSKQRRELSWMQLYKEIMNNPQDYDLLCATCNWIKRAENNEATGNPGLR